MLVLIALGSLNLIMAFNTSKWWWAAIDSSFALFAFFVAWLCYCDARKASKEIDNLFELIQNQMGLHLLLLKTVVKPEQQDETIESDDHEDVGCPV